MAMAMATAACWRRGGYRATSTSTCICSSGSGQVVRGPYCASQPTDGSTTGLTTGEATECPGKAGRTERCQIVVFAVLFAS